ncbi:sulfurtransferase TusA family protein [Meiothermus sp.]|uniref:sulfurtransferase TusA family protein n=1 Tax=Meiothermus sp. TaxID=1955249 RepID=UPI0021DB9B8A|nr:sulfurtransferase TusA family protein [Meiothermus sp.]GIW25311.1 MAG: preprotein translocase subunit TatB [Meiothermus sp.]
MVSPVQITKEIDARGSFCPGPLMELIRNIKTAQVGDVIAVLSGDPGSVKDIPAWVEKAKHEFLGIEDVEGEVKRFIVRKAH